MKLQVSDNRFLILGRIFEGFNEAHINFPPTHKFVLGTNDYVNDRIPSYTVKKFLTTKIRKVWL